jgi:hypothetical protein
MKSVIKINERKGIENNKCILLYYKDIPLIRYENMYIIS